MSQPFTIDAMLRLPRLASLRLSPDGRRLVVSVGGVAPEQAVRYQIVIMYQLVAATAVSGWLAVWFARRLLFTPRAQLIVPPAAES